MTTEFIGFWSIILTIIFWGTWLIFSRKSAEKIANPFLENILITVGALLCNLVIFLIYSYLEGFYSFDIVTFGAPFLSGVLWSIAGLFAFLSVGRIGVGKAMSVWAPSGMLVSFLWGILYYDEFESNSVFAFLAIVLIIIGVVSVIRIRSEKEEYGFALSGVCFALLSSLVWGGTYLIPIRELGSLVSPFATLLPLSVGMLCGAISIFLIKNKEKNISIESIKKGVPIIISGCIWALGNLFAVIAVFNIGIGKAYPMAELCGVLNALLAVFLLKEIQDKKKISLFLFATGISFLGAIWLSILKI